MYTESHMFNVVVNMVNWSYNSEDVELDAYGDNCGITTRIVPSKHYENMPIQIY